VTYCRYCGAPIAADSVFCAKCGKRLTHGENPRLEKVMRRFYLRTPYPYAAMLILTVIALGWAWTPNIPPTDYTALKLSLKFDRDLDIPDDNLFQQGFSLVLENSGVKAVRNVRVDLDARITPPQPAEIVASFLGQKLLIMADGKALPLTIELTDEIPPGAKRSFSMEGSIRAVPPFEATYELRQENSDVVLANYVLQR